MCNTGSPSIERKHLGDILTHLDAENALFMQTHFFPKTLPATGPSVGQYLEIKDDHSSLVTAGYDVLYNWTVNITNLYQ